MESTSSDSQSALVIPYYVKIIHPDLIQTWRSNPNSMKCCRDRCGVKQSVREYNGFFQIRIGMHLRNAKKFVIPESGWVPVVPLGGNVTREQLVDAYGLDYVEYQESISNKPPDAPLEFVVNNPRILEASQHGFSAMNEAARALVAQNHTGRHHRNKKISIPTCPGEPVRG